ncbi:MAG TPA: ribbon-helix-helix domain-containing protein [Candidatus Paceibacterota bacterium]|nr:ribbon-helix-helix domain-containing protein [Candidatus Paceibacterota bacterium]
MKSVLIDEEIHKMLKDVSKKSGIKIRCLVENGILLYLKRIKLKENENEDM